MSVNVFFKNVFIMLVNLFFTSFGTTLFQIINRREIWLRMLYYESAMSKELTRIWRPYDRTNGKKGFKAGDEIDLRFIEQPGNDKYGIPPIFKPNCMKAKIRDSRCLKIAELKKTDFSGSGPFITDKKSLLHELSLVYDLNPREISTVTYFIIEYL